MRKPQPSTEILRRYIRESLFLKEDSFSGVDSFGYAGSIDPLGYGPMSADPGPLVNTFITPFTDVFKTIVASTKAITVDAATLLNVAFRVALTTIIPVIGARYDKIFAERDKKIEAIESEYKEVFDRTREAFEGDAQLLAFMASPVGYLSSVAALKTPAVTKEVLSIATGGFSDSAFEKTKSLWDRLQERILAGEKASSLRRERDYLDDEFLSSLSSRINSRRKRRSESFSRFSQSYLKEDISKRKVDKRFDAFLKDMLSNKKIVNALSDTIKNNEKLQDLKTKLTKVEDETLKSADDLAQNTIRNVRTFEDIEKLVGNNPKARQSLDKIKNIEDSKQREEALSILVSNIKTASKQTFMVTLGSRQKLFPKGTELHEKYQEAINKLKRV